MRRALTTAEFVGAALLIAVGVPLILYALLLGMRAGTPQERSWYETTALVPFIPAVITLSTAGWLIRDARRR
jgi:hypothetical protein